MMAEILFIIFLIAFLILFVVASSLIAILFHIYREDPAHQNSVNVPRGTTTSRTDSRINKTKK